MGFAYTLYDVLQTTMFFRSPNRIMSCRFYWTPSVSIAPSMDATKILNLANECFDEFAPIITPLMNEDTFFDKVRAEWFGQNGDGYWDAFSNSAAEEGDLGGNVADELEAMPDTVALCIQKRTGKQGRNNMGRVFIPCISEEAVAAGKLDPGEFAEANAVAAFMSSDRTWDGTVFHARHWSRDPDEMVPIVQARVNVDLSTRVDRKARGYRLTT